MPKITKKDLEFKPVEKVYTDIELQQLHDKLDKYKVTQTLRSGEEVSIIDFGKFHQEEGSMSKDGIIVEHDGFGDIVTPTKYEKVEDMIRQYKKWMGRKEYGQKMRTKDMEELTTKMDMKNNIPYPLDTDNG